MIVVLAIFGTTAPFLFSVAGLTRLEASTYSVITTIEPILGIIEDIAHIMLKVTAYVMLFAPIAVWAAITSRPGAQPDAAELTEHCRKNLSVFKVPKKFLFIDAMPRTSSGKIRKMDLREKYRHQAA